MKKVLTEVNSCGMSKRARCRANGINKRKLYYWQHLIWQTESTRRHLPAKQDLPVKSFEDMPDNGFVEVHLQSIEDLYSRRHSTLSGRCGKPQTAWDNPFRILSSSLSEIPFFRPITISSFLMHTSGQKSRSGSGMADEAVLEENDISAKET